MVFTLEVDVYDGEAYTSTDDEVTVLLNGTKLTGIPSAYQNSITPGSVPACAPGQTCGAFSSYSGAPNGYGSVWVHVGPIDITARVIAGTNVLTFSELSPHSSGIANIVVKRDGVIILNTQPSGLPDLSGCVSPNNPCTCANCYVFNGPATFTVNFTGAATPRADFTYAPLAPSVGQAVSFQSAASGGTPPYTYSWNFGDGTSPASGITASHSFAVAGQYTVTLSVTDSAGIVGMGQHTINVAGGHILSISSTPTPISFTINGQTAATPFSSNIADGSYTVTFPQTVQIGGVTYTFSSWSDGQLNATRAVSVTADIALSAFYIGQGLTHTLTVHSAPTGVVQIMINGVTQNTPYSQVLPEAIYTVIVPASALLGGAPYSFQSWTDGSTSLARVVSLLTDITLTANYVAVNQNHTLSISSSPSGITVQINGQSLTTPVNESIAPGQYTITMPPTTTVGGVTYSFQKWSDGQTINTRTINLTADTALSATYTTGSGVPPPDLTLVAAVIGGTAIIGAVGIYFATRKKGGGGQRSGGGPR